MGDPCADLQTACRQAHQLRGRNRIVVDLGAKCSLETGLGGACNVLDLTRTPAGATLRIDLYEPEPECLWHDDLPVLDSRIVAREPNSRCLERQDHPTWRCTQQRSPDGIVLKANFGLSRTDERFEEA